MFGDGDALGSDGVNRYEKRTINARDSMPCPEDLSVVAGGRHGADAPMRVATFLLLRSAVPLPIKKDHHAQQVGGKGYIGGDALFHARLRRQLPERRIPRERRYLGTSMSFSGLLVPQFCVGRRHTSARCTSIVW